MVFGGKFRIRRCNSKASYLPRQSLEKLSNTDPDHGSYKLTLTSNEDLVANTKPSAYDILAHNGKIPPPNNLPDVLPLGAKLHSPQPASPTSANGSSPLRYGSNNNLASNSSSPTQQQSSPHYPMYPTQHHRYSTPAMNSYNNITHNSHAPPPSYTRSQSYDVNSSNCSPTKFMSQSTIDLKRTHNLETTLEETGLPDSMTNILSPAQSENNLSSPSKTLTKPSSPYQRSEERCGDATSEGRIFRAELVNATLSNSTANKPVITRKDSLRENIEKITQLQSKLMSAHLADNGLLSGYGSCKSLLSPIARTNSVEESKPVELKDPAGNLSQNQNPNTTSDNCQTNAAVETTEPHINEIGRTEEDSPPSLPKTPPPSVIANDDNELSLQTDTNETILPRISQMDSSTDGLKLMQRSELILRFHPPTTTSTVEAASQTDDLPDSDMGRLTAVQHGVKDETQTRHITLQPRERHPIEIDCDNMSKELASMLSPNDKLIEVLTPQTIKSPADYVSNLYNPNVPLRPAKRDVGTSTLMRMKMRGDVPQEAPPTERTVTVELQYAEIEVSLTNGNGEGDSCDLTKQKVDELIKQLSRKLRILSNEQAMIADESAINDELGTGLATKLTDKVRPLDATKFRTYIDDIGHITSLLLSLSERLARAENSLSTLADNNAEKKTLESKRDRLLEQLEEAKRLKEDIDRRGASVASMLEKNLTIDEYADYDYFINMKAKLIADARDVADRIKCGEEQLSALSETLIQSDC